MQLCNSFTMPMQNSILLHLGLNANDLESKPWLLETKWQCVRQIWTAGSMAEFLYWTVQQESDCHIWRVWTKKSVLRCISYSFSVTQDTKIVAHSCVASDLSFICNGNHMNTSIMKQLSSYQCILAFSTLQAYICH